ncbi:lysine N(6)-hydroxylase/L-ornithine N(5)-oxygenase family protein [Marinobacter arenosus]|uniref:lysine N(6)-hydroxylase/L-ornithine N(5)-oxygenase family protein n=1 Tax=Marinobacter arenosus TaxID=2856822 RepID=UPI001C4BA862|nr:lysine N(6)-hydroxylase/L-ornithine N(5)-oxygenase family protein [Marinobacter arenosus]MBW0148088.1 lysine N(6)-hydroxylase/L-ornithine N(5)-oxygenase family protein [Marinobacter arenosus]
MTDRCYDFIAIGLGPFNLSLACLAAPLDDLHGLVLDENPEFNWHPGMMLEGTHLQTPFLSDLVTLADPTSPFSFLNYIKEQGRIYSFYIRENFFLQRREYNQYCQWAARRLDNLRFDTRVERIDYEEGDGLYRVSARCTRTGALLIFRARRLVLGTGPRPWVPDCCHDLPGPVWHSSRYLDHKRDMQAGSSITVVGSGQSAAEIFHDLLQDIDGHGYSLSWITGSPRFFPLDYSKLTLEMTSPEYVDYFHDLPPETRDRLLAEQKHLYKGINTDLINAIHDLLYVKRLERTLPVMLATNSRLVGAHVDAGRGDYQLDLHHTEQDRRYHHHSQALVLATGYQYQPPDFLSGIRHRIRWDDRGRFSVRRNYSIDTAGGEIFVQNAELHTHGFVTPDLGMACYRNACILRALTGREPYPVEDAIAFQTFGAPDGTARPANAEME